MEHLSPATSMARLRFPGINGRVQIGSAVGRATFKGINGNMVVGLKKIDQDGVTLNGINGNIELQLGSDVNADFDARGHEWTRDFRLAERVRSIRRSAGVTRRVSVLAALGSRPRELTETSGSRECRHR